MEQSPEKFYFAKILRSTVATCLALLAGCGIFPSLNKTPAPLPEKQWKTLTGQVLYRDPKRSFVGDVTIRSAADSKNYSLQVTKAGATLLKLDRQGANGWSRGPASGLPFSGKITAAPTHLQRWFAATDAAIAKPPNAANPPTLATHPASGPEIKFQLQP